MEPKRPMRPGFGPAPPGKPGATGPPGSRGGASQAPASGAASSVAARRASSLNETFDQLHRDIRLLQIEFEKFFNGAVPVPPEEMRSRIQLQIRNLRNLKQISTLEAFRLGDVEARFNSYNELFNRRVRDREEGRRVGALHAATPEARRYDPQKGITFGGSFDPEAVEALYQGLASRPGDGPKFDLDSFEKYLARQVAALREKTGCDQVQFRLAEEDGKLKLKARPVPRAGS